MKVKYDFMTKIKNLFVAKDQGINNANKNIITDANGQITTEDKFSESYTDLTNKPIFYGTCSTSASTQQKIVITSSDFHFTAGTILIVKFTNAQTHPANSTNPLKIRINTDSSNVKNVLGAQASYDLQNCWVANEVVTFVYDGTNFILVDTGIATTTNYGITRLSDSTSSNSTSLAASANAVSTTYTRADNAYTLADGKADRIHEHTISQINDFPNIPSKISDLTNDLKTHTHTKIAANTNLNSIITSGWYYNNNSSNVKTMSNTPWQEAPPETGSGKGQPFAMEVLFSFGLIQILYPYSESGMWIRKYTKNINVELTVIENDDAGWTDWIQIAKVSDIPTKISDLTNDSNFIETSNTTGLVKNDGTIDTTSYSTFNIFYGTCTTGASEQVKTITTSSDYVLTEGTVLIVKFTNAQSYNASASTPVQLKVNGSNTTVNVAIAGTTLTSRYHWTAGEVVTFVYDGTNFIIESEGMATTTYYGVTKLSSSTTSTSESLAATPKAVKTAYDLADGKANAEHTHSDSGITYNGGKTNGVTPIDFAASEELNPNRLAFLNPNNITLEYSDDGTNSWTSFGDDSSKIKLVTKEEILKAGNNDLNSLDNALSITLDAGGVYNSTDSDIYLQPEKLLIYFNDGGSTGCYCDISISTYSNPNAFLHKYTYQIEGNYGWNSIPLDIGLWGGFKDQITGSRVQKIKLEFTTQEAYNFKVSKIRMYGANSYIPQRNANSMAAIGHMYDYDEYGNVIFPGTVNAHSFAMPRITYGNEKILLADGSLLHTDYYMKSFPETDVLYNTDISSDFSKNADIINNNCTYIIFRKMGNMVVATFRLVGASIGSSYIDVLANGVTIPEKYLPPVSSTNLGPISVNIANFSGDPVRTVTTVIDSSNGSVKVRANGSSTAGLNTWFTMTWFTDNTLLNMFGA